MLVKIPKCAPSSTGYVTPSDSAIFIFDGEGRPEIKRGKKVKKTPHWLKRAFVDMLGLFGFAVHEVTVFLSTSLSTIELTSSTGTS
jgi:hypothetical protein